MLWHWQCGYVPKPHALRGPKSQTLRIQCITSSSIDRYSIAGCLQVVPGWTASAWLGSAAFAWLDGFCSHCVSYFSMDRVFKEPYSVNSSYENVPRWPVHRTAHVLHMNCLHTYMHTTFLTTITSPPHTCHQRPINFAVYQVFIPLTTGVRSRILP